MTQKVLNQRLEKLNARPISQASDLLEVDIRKNVTIAGKFFAAARFEKRKITGPNNMGIAEKITIWLNTVTGEVEFDCGTPMRLARK